MDFNKLANQASGFLSKNNNNAPSNTNTNAPAEHQQMSDAPLNTGTSSAGQTTEPLAQQGMTGNNTQGSGIAPQTGMAGTNTGGANAGQEDYGDKGT